jgi:hypothetical protein
MQGRLNSTPLLQRAPEPSALRAAIAPAPMHVAARGGGAHCTSLRAAFRQAGESLRNQISSVECPASRIACLQALQAHCRVLRRPVDLSEDKAMRRWPANAGGHVALVVDFALSKAERKNHRSPIGARRAEALLQRSVNQGSTMNRFKRLLLSSTLLALAGATTGQAQAQGQAEVEAATAPVRYRLTVLDPLPGFSRADAVAINAKGQVVVNSIRNGPEPFQSYVWQNNTVTPVPIELASDINFRGWITGLSFDEADLTQAEIFKGSGSVIHIDTHGVGARGVSINNRGHVLVTTFNPFRHFLYKGGALISLSSKGMLVANTVNDLDQVAGQCQGLVACIYDNGRIRRLAPQKLLAGTAVRINRQGQVIGIFQGGARNFLYDNGAVIELNFVPRDINNAGTIVGHNGIGAQVRVGGKAYNLNTLTNGLNGFHLKFPISINGRGEIVGLGDSSAGEQRGFLLQPITAATDAPAN